MYRNDDIIDKFTPTKGCNIIYIMTCIPPSEKSYIGQAHDYLHL